MNILEQLIKSGVVAVVRGATQNNIIPITSALQEGGIKSIEITAETPMFVNLIEKVVAEFGDEMIVGAGTVLDSETAKMAITAGANFVFSPTVNTDTIRLTKRYGLVSIPGALTPTEILKAYEHGADIVKVFPSSAFGPRYLKEVHGPLPQIPLMPTGGINKDNVREYIKAGAIAVGVGSTLVNVNKITNESCYNQITTEARQLISAVQEARNE